jgi:hypothetical protein
MFKRLLRALAYVIGMLLVVPGLIQWIIFDTNTGWNLIEWATDDDC